MLSSSSSSSRSSSSSSSSSGIAQASIYPIVALATRSYGEGKICIHTDRMGGVQTGHGDNPRGFWRRIFQWVSSKGANDLIRTGLVINTSINSADRINTFSPISVEKLTIPQLSFRDISGFDCLYIVGLPEEVSDNVTSKIEEFVREGGGLILEYPNNGGENINILRDVEEIFCYSAERILYTYAYWTIVGGEHPIFDGDVDIAFMSTLRQSDFSSNWNVLMTDVPHTVTTTTVTSPDQALDFGKSSASEFGISYTTAMQKGIVTLQTGEYVISSSSSSSSSSLSSESSSSSSS